MSGAGVLCAAGMMSTAGKVLSEKMDVIQLTFYTAPISCALLFPFFVVREVQCHIHYHQQGPQHCFSNPESVNVSRSIAHCELKQQSTSHCASVQLVLPPDPALLQL